MYQTFLLTFAVLLLTLTLTFSFFSLLTKSFTLLELIQKFLHLKMFLIHQLGSLQQKIQEANTKCNGLETFSFVFCSHQQTTNGLMQLQEFLLVKAHVKRCQLLVRSMFLDQVELFLKETLHVIPHSKAKIQA